MWGYRIVESDHTHDGSIQAHTIPIHEKRKQVCMFEWENLVFSVFHNHIHVNRDIEIETFTANLYLGPSFFVPDE